MNYLNINDPASTVDELNFLLAIFKFREEIAEEYSSDHMIFFNRIMLIQKIFEFNIDQDFSQ